MKNFQVIRRSDQIKFHTNKDLRKEDCFEEENLNRISEKINKRLFINKHP